MPIWSFFDFSELSGKNKFAEWLEALPLADQARIDNRLLQMVALARWPEKWVSKYQSAGALYEFRIKGRDVQYRPLGSYYGKHRYILLAGAIEKGDKILQSDVDVANERHEKAKKMPSMLSRINSTAKAIWKKMRNREYRESFVASHISNTISAQIHSMRHARGWTQGELAARADMKQPRISALEDPEFENVEVATLLRIASAFDVALSVRFVPFSEIAERVSNLAVRDFSVRQYGEDALSESKRIEAVVTNIAFQISRTSSEEQMPVVDLPLSGDYSGTRFGDINFAIAEPVYALGA